MPKHIKYFEWLFLASLVIGIIISAIAYSEIVTPGMEGVSAFIQFFVISVVLLLIFLTSRKRNKIAKWILVVIFGLGIVFFIPQLSTLFDLGFMGILPLLQALTQCIGIYFLFTKESLDWFRIKKAK